MQELPFDHEKLDVYRVSVEFLGWAGQLLDGPLKGARISAVKHLDEAATSILANIAEGNGKRSRPDRCRFFDIARGSALECAACLDVLVVRKRLGAGQAALGKRMLVRIVSMLSKLTESLLGPATFAHGQPGGSRAS
jgi:four helix bundle protein